MSRNGPHTSTKKLSWWNSSTKIFFQFYNSKREKKSLSSSDFVTAAGMVQQSANSNGSTSARKSTSTGERERFGAGSRFARLLWVIYTSHSSYSYYCTD